MEVSYVTFKRTSSGVFRAPFSRKKKRKLNDEKTEDFKCGKLALADGVDGLERWHPCYYTAQEEKGVFQAIIVNFRMELEFHGGLAEKQLQLTDRTSKHALIEQALEQACSQVFDERKLSHKPDITPSSLEQVRNKFLNRFVILKSHGDIDPKLFEVHHLNSYRGHCMIHVSECKNNRRRLISVPIQDVEIVKKVFDESSDEEAATVLLTLSKN